LAGSGAAGCMGADPQHLDEGQLVAEVQAEGIAL
jgi:hypothetical protein